MEESAALITSMTTWFTPTLLFIFLNLMIATILFTSNLPNKPPQQTPNHLNKPFNQNHTVQSKPSLLHRLKSFNLYPYTSQHEPSNYHQQQEALEIAATQYVFNHPFSDEQDPLQQPVFENPKSSHFDPTRIEKEPPSVTHSFTHDQRSQPISPSLKRFDFDPTHVEKEASSVNESLGHEQDLHSVSANLQTLDFDPTRTGSNPTHVKKEASLVNEGLGYEQDLHPVSANLRRLDFDPTRMDSDPTHDEENDELESLDEVYSKITGGHVNRTKSDTLPASGEVPLKLPAKMKKSASLKSAFAHFEEDKIVEARRPATVRERRVAAEDDVEVDAKADDFINKFKHQLKLQRLDSIIRYKDMVNRGGGK